MVKEGYYFGVPLLLAGGAALFLRWNIAAGALIFLALFVFSFFRNPERVIPSEPGAIVSPGDGRVVVVQDEEYQGKQQMKVEIATGGGRVTLKNTMSEQEKRGFMSRIAKLDKQASPGTAKAGEAVNGNGRKMAL